jgi:hypothetical protein
MARPDEGSRRKARLTTQDHVPHRVPKSLGFVQPPLTRAYFVSTVAIISSIGRTVWLPSAS